MTRPSIARDGLAVLVGMVATAVALGWSLALVLFGAKAFAWTWSLLGI